MLLGMSKLPKIISFLFCCNILGKKWVMKLIFCIQISMKVSYKLILWFFLWIVKHSQSSGDSKFVMSLQYLKSQVEMKLIFCIIIKVCWTLVSTLWAYRVIKKKKLGKEVRDGLCFFLHADKHQSFYKLALLFLMEVDMFRHAQSTQ